MGVDDDAAPFSMAEHFSTDIPEVISSEKKTCRVDGFWAQNCRSGPDSLVFLGIFHEHTKYFQHFRGYVGIKLLVTLFWNLSEVGRQICETFEFEREGCVIFESLMSQKEIIK